VKVDPPPPQRTMTAAARPDRGLELRVAQAELARAGADGECRDRLRCDVRVEPEQHIEARRAVGPDAGFAGQAGDYGRLLG